MHIVYVRFNNGCSAKKIDIVLCVVLCVAPPYTHLEQSLRQPPEELELVKVGLEGGNSCDDPNQTSRHCHMATYFKHTTVMHLNAVFDQLVFYLRGRELAFEICENLKMTRGGVWTEPEFVLLVQR